jgi:hypothetical protein
MNVICGINLISPRWGFWFSVNDCSIGRCPYAIYCKAFSLCYRSCMLEFLIFNS